MAWTDATLPRRQGRDLLQIMVNDLLLFLWTLELVADSTSRVKHYLWGLIEACHAFVSMLNQESIIGGDLAVAISDRQQEMLFLTMVIADPPDGIQQYFEARLKEDEVFRTRIRVITEKMLHALPSDADKEWLRVRLTRVKTTIAQLDGGPDTQSRTQSPGNSHQRAETRALTFPEPPRRYGPSIGSMTVPRSSTSAADAQLSRLSLQQADPSSPPPDRIGDHSTRQGDPPAPSYLKNDLIDLVASRKASPAQQRSFKSQVLNNETFHQQSLDRIDIYASRSEEQKRRKLRAVLEGMRKEKANTAAGASGQQPSKKDEATKDSKESPTKKEPATVRPSASSATVTTQSPPRTLTREEKLAIQYRASTALQNRFCEELENACPRLSLAEVSAEVQKAIQIYRHQAALRFEETRGALLPAGPVGADPPRGRAEANQAYEELYRAQTRFTGLNMLAAASGPAAKEAADKILAKFWEAKASVAAREAR